MTVQEPEEPDSVTDVAAAFGRMMISPEVDAALAQINQHLGRLLARPAGSMPPSTEILFRRLDDSLTRFNRRLAEKVTNDMTTPLFRASVQGLAKLLEDSPQDLAVQPRDEADQDQLLLPVDAVEDLQFSAAWGAGLFVVLYGFVKDVMDDSARDVAEHTIVAIVLVLMIALGRDIKRHGL